MPELSQLFDAILKGDARSAIEITRTALGNGTDPTDLVTKIMIPAMDEVGKRFENQEYFVPELLISARAMRSALDIIRPLISEKGAAPAGRIVIGTVKGDLHDIGKNLVASMLEGGGFEVFDLGTDVPPVRFVIEAQTKGATLVALSALLTTTMVSMKATIDEFHRAGWRDKVKIMIGGAPVTLEYAEQVGADGYSDNANGAVALARRLAAS